MSSDDPKPDTPFPKHWIFYIAIKIAVVVVAALFALRYFGMI
jgi:hypothetical protein